jgi:hypothetical protein
MNAPHRPPITGAAQKREGPSRETAPNGGKGDQTLGNSRRKCKKVRHHKGSAEDVHLGRRGRRLKKVKTLGQNVVGKPIHIDDCRRDPPSPAIRDEVQAWIKEDLMAVVSEESGGSRQQPPIRGRSGVISVTDRSRGA